MQEQKKEKIIFNELLETNAESSWFNLSDRIKAIGDSIDSYIDGASQFIKKGADVVMYIGKSTIVPLWSATKAAWSWGFGS